MKHKDANAFLELRSFLAKAPHPPKAVLLENSDGLSKAGPPQPHRGDGLPNKYCYCEVQLVLERPHIIRKEVTSDFVWFKYKSVDRLMSSV